MKQYSADIATLPERERKLYNEIRSRYQVTFDRFEVNGKQLRLLKIADLEEFLGGKDPLANVSEFPFWVRLWDAAKVLAYFLGAQKEVEGQRLLELGAGLGAPGLAAASAGFSVTLSDYEEIILNFQRISAAASGLKEVECVHLDWLAPRGLGSFDVLVGAEILFRDSFFTPLLQIFKTYLKPNGSIFLAHEATRKSLPMFLALAEEYFVIATKKQTIRVDGHEKTIILNRLQPKNKSL
jgi:predicted nicotinamide N-methyase